MNHQPSGCNPFCPACEHRSWSEADSIAQKQAFLERVLEPWKDVLHPLFTVHGSERWGYRRQAILHASWDQGWRYGLRRRDEVIPIPDCPVHHQHTNDAVRLMASVLPAPHEFPLAFFVLSGAQMVLVVKSGKLTSLSFLNDGLMDAMLECGIEGLWIHLHPSAGKRIFGKGGWHLLWGAVRSRDENGMLYGPASFQQLIPGLYQSSVDLAAGFLAPDRQSAVADLYSGTGSSVRRWKAEGAEAIGVEWSGEAVECALENLPGTVILRGLCRDRIPQLMEWGRAKKAEGRRPLLYANPPRTGLEPEVTLWATRDFRPERIAYLSCSAGTLSRDLKMFCNAGYRVVSLQPYDFFPQTRHVECLALMEFES